MDKEVKEYLESISKLLNGQLRGAINLKAREENLEFVMLTLTDVWNKSHEWTLSLIEDQKTIEEIKKLLKDEPTEP